VKSLRAQLNAFYIFQAAISDTTTVAVPSGNDKLNMYYYILFRFFLDEYVISCTFVAVSNADVRMRLTNYTFLLDCAALRGRVF